MNDVGSTAWYVEGTALKAKLAPGLDDERRIARMGRVDTSNASSHRAPWTTAAKRFCARGCRTLRSRGSGTDGFWGVHEGRG